MILAQATEVFFEKCAEEKKINALVSKIASQAGSMYTTLTEDVKEFMGKGIFDRNWITLLQVRDHYSQLLFLINIQDQSEILFLSYSILPRPRR
jgi:hypothetical protein